MSLGLTKTAANVYDPVTLNGDLRNVVIDEVRLLHTEVEGLLVNAVRAAGAILFSTKAEADANLAYEARLLAWITNDPTPALNGIYKKNGGSGTGSWVRASDLPYQVIAVSLAGTADALVGTTVLPVPTEDRAAILVLSPTAANTVVAPTLAINGETPRTIKDNSGAPLVVGSLAAGGITLMVKLGADYRLLTAANFAALAASAQASATAAAASAAAAAGSAGTSAPSRYATRALFISATIAAAVNVVTTDSYATSGDGGGAVYIRLGATAPVPVKRWHEQSADSTWWEMRSFPVNLKQLGALGNGTADDTIPTQAWSEYSSTFKVPGIAPGGTYLIPTASITMASDANLSGVGSPTVFQRTNDGPVPLFLGTGAVRPRLSDMLLNNTAGLASTSSNTISVGSKTFVTTAGRNFAAGQSVFLVAVASPTNYMIGTVTSYTGTSMVINITTAVGSGTFTSWQIHRNSGENVACRMVGCENGQMTRVRTTGPFYVALEQQNANAGMISNCEISGCLNRPLYVYGTSGTCDDVSVIDNLVIGGGFTQYGINLNGSGGLINNCLIRGNRLEGLGFQGIEVGGSSNNCIVNGNIIEDLATNAAAIFIQLANGFAPSGTTVTSNSIKNSSIGVYVLNCSGTIVSVNNIQGGSNGVRVARNSTGSCLGTIVSGNVIRGYGSGAISFESDAAGLCGHGVISGNFMNGLGSGQFGFQTGALSDRIAFSSNVSISNASNSAGGTNHGSSGDSVLA